MTLTHKTKLAYGIGDLGTAITANLVAFFLLIFLTDTAKVAPALAGAILLVGKLWDAINDPIVGWLSDQTRSRWGRRRPWLLWGAIPFGLSFAMLWWIPFPDNPTALVIYYFVASLLYNTFYTVVNLPYSALTPELTEDYDDRTTLNNYRFAFSIGGSIVSAVLQLPLVQWVGYGGAGLTWAIVAVISVLICFWGTYEQPRHAQQLTVNIPYWEQVRIALSSKPFLCVIGIYLCGWIALQATAAVIPYYITYWMRPDQPDQVIPLAILAVQGSAFVMLFVWNQLSQRIGKKAVFTAGASLWFMAQLGLFLVHPQQLSLLYILAVLAGLGVSVTYIIPWAMIPDVIDLDELHTGKRREGIFYGFMVLLQKVALAGALFAVGLALELAGFIPPVDKTPMLAQPDSVLQLLRWLIAPVPSLLLIVGIVLARLYPITKAKHQEILAQLSLQREALGDCQT